MVWWQGIGTNQLTFDITKFTKGKGSQYGHQHSFSLDKTNISISDEDFSS